MSLIDRIAEAMAMQEGFYKPGSRASRNNNPGNLRAAPGNHPKDDKGFVVFPTSDEGFAALRRQITLDVNRGLTLREFIWKFAPPNENLTENYIRFVCSRVNAADDIPLRDLVEQESSGAPPSPSASEESV